MFPIALPSASQLLLLFASFTYLLPSTAHLYMPQIFTHCLPTIICVTLRYIVYYALQSNCLYTFFVCALFSTHYILFIAYVVSAKNCLSPCISCILFLCRSMLINFLHKFLEKKNSTQCQQKRLQQHRLHFTTNCTQMHILFVKVALGTTLTSWSQHHFSIFIALGKSER